MIPRPAENHDVLVSTRPADPVPAVQRAYHTFAETSHIVVTTHSDVVLLRESAWTATGGQSAREDAERAVRRYRIDQAPTDLTVWMLRRERHFDRLYVGDGPNPHWWNGSDKPRIVPLYEGYATHFRVTSLIVLYRSDQITGAAGDAAPTFLAEHHYVQGD